MICSGNYTYVSSTSHKIDPTSRALAGIGDDISIRVNSAYCPLGHEKCERSRFQFLGLLLRHFWHVYDDDRHYYFGVLF